MRTKRALLAIAVVIAACSPATKPLPNRAPAPVNAAAGLAPAATATLHDLVGLRVGTVTFLESHAGIIVYGDVSGLGLGAHAVHIHEVGKCEPPFTTAGGHFNPTGRHHGYRNPEGPHLGDLPNIDTPAAGRRHFEFLLPGVTLKGENALLDKDGASIVFHSTRDDYLTDPAGNSGSRIACGVIIAK